MIHAMEQSDEEKTHVCGFVGGGEVEMTASSFIHETSCMIQRAEIFKWMKMLVQTSVAVVIGQRHNFVQCI